MDTNPFETNYGTIPNNFNMTIFSNGETTYYKLTPEQNSRYQALKDKSRSSYISSFISSFLGFSSTITCTVLLWIYFNNPTTRTYILCALGFILISWATHAYYLDYENKQVADSINELLSQNIVTRTQV